jgi:hypothetical protein
MYILLFYLVQFSLEWQMFQTKVVQKIKTHILCSITFVSENILWDNVEKFCTAGQAIDNIRHMRVACWVPKATNTHSEYVVLIAFPLQQWLHESASLLRYTYIVCIVQFSLEESREEIPRLGRFETLQWGLLNTERRQFKWMLLGSFNAANRAGVPTAARDFQLCFADVFFNCTLLRHAFQRYMRCLFIPTDYKPVWIAAPDQTCT